MQAGCVLSLLTGALAWCCGLGAAVAGSGPAPPPQQPTALVLGWGPGQLAVVTLADWRIHWVSHGLTKGSAFGGVWYSAASRKIVVDLVVPNVLGVFDPCSGEKRVWYSTISEGELDGLYEGSYIVPGDDGAVYVEIQPRGTSESGRGVPPSEGTDAHQCFARYDLRTESWRHLNRAPTIRSRLAMYGFSSPSLYLAAAADAVAQGRNPPPQDEHLQGLEQAVAAILIGRGVLRQNAVVDLATQGVVATRTQDLEDTILRIDDGYVLCRVRGGLTVLARNGEEFRAVASSPPGFGSGDLSILCPEGVAFIFDPSVPRCLRPPKE